MSDQHMPEIVWPQVSDIVVNHEGGRPDPVNDLHGHTFSAMDGKGNKLEFRFDDEGLVHWTSQTASQHSKCEVLLIRPGWYFVDFQESKNPNRSHSLVLDTLGRRVLHIDVLAPAENVPDSLLERVSKRGTQSAVDLHIWQGHWGGVSPEFERTTSLVGTHFRYRYSDTHIYDHVYLSDRYYTWYCHFGPDAGLGDFEECDYLQLDSDLFFVCWKEKMIPCVGVTVEDLASMRSIGKIFGADAYTGAAANRTVGAEMSLVSTFSAPVQPAKK